MNNELSNISVGTNSETLRGLVFDVQGHSVHDGPGTRTTVFLNGCPLSCVWCSNPEGLHRKKVMMHMDSRCECCGNCIETCPEKAVSIVDGELSFDRSLCDYCTGLDCIETCYHEALTCNSDEYSVSELMRIFKRDRQFWGSKGGVTFSGGEPLFQKKFILALLKECKKKFIHTCIETTSCIETNFYLEATSYVDWIFTDIKHMDSDIHKKLTGVGTELIHKNIEKLATRDDWDGVLLPRIPIIPGKNDSDKNISETCDFIKDIGLDALNILPFHRLGESKYRQLGQVYSLAEQESPSDEHMQHLKSIADQKGLYCFVGWDTPF